nr:unnamed protein product [Callosobruchus analis]
MKQRAKRSLLLEYWERTQPCKKRVGPEVTGKLAVRWNSYLSQGVNKETWKKQEESSSIPANCTMLQGPMLNCEVQAMLSSVKLKKDSFLNDLQGELRKGNNATTYGKESELRAIKDFEKIMNLNVSQCGFFVDEEHFYLGASPDGLVGEHDILEIKCPYSIVKMSSTEAILKGKIKFANLVDNSLHLKRNHDYYYQIFYDQQFWQEMIPKLRQFYEQSMLPELVDPLFPKGLPIRGNVQFERGPFLLMV